MASEGSLPSPRRTTPRLDRAYPRLMSYFILFVNSIGPQWFCAAAFVTNLALDVVSGAYTDPDPL